MLPQSVRAPLRQHHSGALARLFAGVLAAFALASGAALSAQEPARIELRLQQAPTGAELGKLFDAVVETTTKHFWDKERLAEVGWEKRAAEVRPSVVEAPNLDEAAR